MTRDNMLQLMNQILKNQGKPPVKQESDSLRDIGFRSLDFSELALRIERSIGREINFDASKLRAIEKVSDVLDFFEGAIKTDASS